MFGWTCERKDKIKKTLGSNPRNVDRERCGVAATLSTPRAKKTLGTEYTNGCE